MTYIIAEIGQAHDGSLGILHSYIDAIADSGANAIKFQTHIAEAESSKDEPFRVNFSYEDDTRFDYWKRMSFTLEQWKGIKDHCEDVGMEFISTPSSNAAVDLLEDVGVRRYKVGSGDTTNYFLLEKIALTKKPIILSSGMHSYPELSGALKFLNNFEADVSLLQCTTSYPTKPEDIGLNVISELGNRFKIPIGFSDHSGMIFAPLAATVNGAKIIEVHVTFDKRMFGPDSSSSLDIGQFFEMVRGIRYLHDVLVSPVDKNETRKFSDLRKMFGKTLAFNRSMKKGEIIGFNDLEHKKPANLGVSADRYKEIIGKRLLRDVGKWDFVSEGDFSE